MQEQNYFKHRRYVIGFHFVLSGLLFLGAAGAVVNVVLTWADGNTYNSVLILLLFICAFFIFWFLREFPIKGQDRAIRAEQGLRYFILTSMPLNSQLSVGQIAALRFAADDEFIKLVDRAVLEKPSPNDIKRAIKNWRADFHRV